MLQIGSWYVGFKFKRSVSHFFVQAAFAAAAAAVVVIVAA